MPKQVVTIELDIPIGFEATGEYRTSEPGDYVWWYGTAILIDDYDGISLPRLILRKI